MEDTNKLVRVKTFISENKKDNLYKIGTKIGVFNLTDILRMAVSDFLNKNASLI